MWGGKHNGRTIHFTKFSVNDVLLVVCLLVQVDVVTTMAFIMSMKEDSEIKIIKRACDITVDVFGKYLKDQVMEIIDADKVCIPAGRSDSDEDDIAPPLTDQKNCRRPQRADGGPPEIGWHRLRAVLYLCVKGNSSPPTWGFELM